MIVQVTCDTVVEKVKNNKEITQITHICTQEFYPKVSWETLCVQCAMCGSVYIVYLANLIGLSQHNPS